MAPSIIKTTIDFVLYTSQCSAITIGQYMAATGIMPRAEFRLVMPTMSANDFGKAKGANNVTDIKESIKAGKWSHLL